MISSAERTRTKEAAGCRIRARMGGLDRGDAFEQRGECPRVPAPQNRHQRLSLARRERPDGLLGHLLPPLASMRPWLARLNREHPVEQEHATFRPWCQVAGGGGGITEVLGVLAEDIDQAAGQPADL